MKKDITMRTFINKVSNKMSFRTVGVLTSLLIVAIVPAAVFAWGPDRPTYTQEAPADHVTFNSITNNPKWGDERNFMRIRDVAANGSFGDTESLQAGRKYEVIVLYHNNASSSLNASGVGIAQGAYARTEIPAIVRSGASNVQAMAYVGATNAVPTSVYDNINLTNSTNADIALRYVKGTAKLTNNGAANGQAISENLFSTNGTPLGFDSLNGVLPGCDHYSGYITFTVVADSPGFSFAKDVRLAGTKAWSDSVTVNQGDKVEYRLSYKNTGTTEQKNVVMKDVLPTGVNYINGQTELINSSYPSGTRLEDGINSSGVNVGSYTAGANAYLYLFATIQAAPCTLLTNTASVETSNGIREDSATVKVAGNCGVTVASTLPTTGPVEIISGLVGAAAITVGIVYYFKSRRDLDDALFDAQSHVTSSKIVPTTIDSLPKIHDDKK